MDAHLPSSPPGSFCWVGLATSDPLAAKAFYARLFDWESEQLSGGSAGEFSLLRREGRVVAILYRQTRQAREAAVRPHWTTFVLTTDAEADAARAAELGGAAVFRAPFQVAGYGRVAAVRDPLGALLSLWEPELRQGPELVNETGALCRSELVTDDLDRSRAFYAALFDWDIETATRGSATIRTRGAVVGVMRHRPDAARYGPPVWLPHFLVDGVAAATESAKRAGGRVVASDGERQALLADPQGATFTVEAARATADAD